MYKYIFGPVPSRRLGMSLGVDLVPHKVCSFNCIYCECGATTNLGVERKEYVPEKIVLEELEHFLSNNPAPEYITFSGGGEPTLNISIGRILKFIKKGWPGIPVAVLTNGSLLSQADLRKELQIADFVLPSLDAAVEDVFTKIDRPFQSINLHSYIQGIVDFRKEFPGEIWLEVFILPGYNDGIDNLDALKNAIESINADRIQLNTLDRPGTVDKLKPATKAELEKIADYWDLPNIEIIAAVPDRKKTVSYRKDIEATILETISRRPCTVEDLSMILGLHQNEINKYLGVLEADDRIESSTLERGVFYKQKKS